MITEEESQDILGSLYMHFLPSTGMNQYFPKAFHYAPLDFFGLDLPLCNEYQGVEQIKRLLVHGMINTPMGNLIHILLELAQLEVGIGTPFLEADFEIYGCLLTDCWLKCLWRFISKHDIVLRNPKQTLPPLQ